MIVVVIGDALCSFNPVYGQGVSVAALEAAALRDCVASRGPRLGSRFFERASRVIDIPWSIAASADLRAEKGPRKPKRSLINRYMERLHRAARVLWGNLRNPPHTKQAGASLGAATVETSSEGAEFESGATHS